MVGLIVSGLSKAVGGYFEHSAKKAKAKSDLKIAEIDAKTAVQKKVAGVVASYFQTRRS